MQRHAARPEKRPLFLTQEEALALLDLCLLANGEHESMRSGLLCRVSDLCREFMRSDEDAPDPAAPTTVHRAVVRILRAGDVPAKPGVTPN